MIIFLRASGKSPTFSPAGRKGLDITHPNDTLYKQFQKTNQIQCPIELSKLKVIPSLCFPKCRFGWWSISAMVSSKQRGKEARVTKVHVSQSICQQLSRLPLWWQVRELGGTVRATRIPPFSKPCSYSAASHRVLSYQLMFAHRIILLEMLSLNSGWHFNQTCNILAFALFSCSLSL